MWMFFYFSLTIVFGKQDYTIISFKQYFFTSETRLEKNIVLFHYGSKQRLKIDFLQKLFSVWVKAENVTL